MSLYNTLPNDNGEKDADNQSNNSHDDNGNQQEDEQNVRGIIVVVAATAVVVVAAAAAAVVVAAAGSSKLSLSLSATRCTPSTSNIVRCLRNFERSQDFLSVFCFDLARLIICSPV